MFSSCVKGHFKPHDNQTYFWQRYVDRDFATLRACFPVESKNDEAREVFGLQNVSIRLGLYIWDTYSIYSMSSCCVCVLLYFLIVLPVISIDIALLYGLRPAPAMPGKNGERRVENKNVIVACEVPGKRFPRVGRGFPTHHSWGPFELFWGHVEGLTLETLSPVASEVASLSLRSIFSPQLCSCLGRALHKCPLNVYVGPSGVYVGAMFAHLEVILGLCCHLWTMLRAMLDRRALCYFHDFTFLPKILLEKALPSGLRGTHSIFATLFLGKTESCLGRAHPRWAPEGSHQWPARFQEFQETLPEKGRRHGAASQ